MLKSRGKGSDLIIQSTSRHELMKGIYHQFPKFFCRCSSCLGQVRPILADSLGVGWGEVRRGETNAFRVCCCPDFSTNKLKKCFLNVEIWLVLLPCQTRWSNIYQVGRQGVHSVSAKGEGLPAER